MGELLTKTALNTLNSWHPEHCACLQLPVAALVMRQRFDAFAGAAETMLPIRERGLCILKCWKKLLAMQCSAASCCMDQESCSKGRRDHM